MMIIVNVLKLKENIVIESGDLVIIKRNCGDVDKFLICSEQQCHKNGALYHDIIDIPDFSKFKFNHFENCKNDGNCNCIENSTVIAKTIRIFKHKK